MFPFFQSAVFNNWSRVVAASIYGSQLLALFVERGTRVLRAYRNAVTQFTLGCCNTIKYESAGSRRWDLWLEASFRLGGGGVALTVYHSPGDNKKNTPRELWAADKVTRIRLDQFLRGRLPGSPLAFAGQTSIQPARKPGSPTRLRAVSELRAADKALSRRAILVASRTFTAWMRPTERFKGAFASFLPTTLLPPSLARIVAHPLFAPWMWHKPPHLDTTPTRVHVKERWRGWAGSSCSSLWIISV